jgi:hypothetical protein
MHTKRTILFMTAILFAGGALFLRAQETGVQPVKVKVVAEKANLREKPDIGSAILQMIPEGTVLDVDEKEREWYLVRYTLEDGGVMAGYIHESLVSPYRPAGGQPATGVEPVPRTADVPGRDSQAPTRTQTGPRRPRVDPDFRISLSGGWSRIRPEDLDAGARGFADSYASFQEVYPEGSADALRSSLHLGIDFSVQIAPQLFFSLGTEILRGANSSSLIFPLDPEPETYTTKPRIQSIPIKAGLTYYPFRRLYLKGVFGYYFVTAEYLYHLATGPDSWAEYRGKATSQGLGAEGSAGWEWSLSRKNILFVEAGYRYAKVGRFVGTESYTDAGGGAATATGTLYYFLQTGGDLRDYPFVRVRESLPEGEGVSGAREAEIDLSGICVRAGIRFRF